LTHVAQAAALEEAPLFGSDRYGGRMPRESRQEEPPPRSVRPPYVPIIRKPGDEGTAFRRIAPAEPKIERQFLRFLGTNGVVVLMYGLLAVVVLVVIVLVVVKG
jgi:hypothetical protein